MSQWKEHFKGGIQASSPKVPSSCCSKGCINCDLTSRVNFIHDMEVTSEILYSIFVPLLVVVLCEDGRDHLSSRVETVFHFPDFFSLFLLTSSFAEEQGVIFLSAPRMFSSTWEDRVLIIHRWLDTHSHVMLSQHILICKFRCSERCCLWVKGNLRGI